MRKLLRQLAFLFPLALLAGCGRQAGNNPFNSSSSLVSSGGDGTTSGSGTTTGSGGGGTTSGTGTTTGSSTGGTTGGTAPGIPANAKLISDIQKLPNWENCSDCTNGAFAAYTMTQGIGSPSLTGASAQF